MSSPVTSVTLSNAAVSFLEEHLSRRPGDCVGMRLSVKTTGCSGYKYVVDYLDQVPEGDHQFPAGSRYVLCVEPKSFPFVKGTCIDVVTQGLSRQWVFHNPNEVSQCGCGESFGVAPASVGDASA